MIYAAHFDNMDFVNKKKKIFGPFLFFFHPREKYNTWHEEIAY